MHGRASLSSLNDTVKTELPWIRQNKVSWSVERKYLPNLLPWMPYWASFICNKIWDGPYVCLPCPLSDTTGESAGSGRYHCLAVSLDDCHGLARDPALCIKAGRDFPRETNNEVFTVWSGVISNQDSVNGNVLLGRDIYEYVLHLSRVAAHPTTHGYIRCATIGTMRMGGLHWCRWYGAKREKMTSTRGWRDHHQSQRERSGPSRGHACWCSWSFKIGWLSVRFIPTWQSPVARDVRFRGA